MKRLMVVIWLLFYSTTTWPQLDHNVSQHLMNFSNMCNLEEQAFVSKCRIALFAVLVGIFAYTQADTIQTYCSQSPIISFALSYWIGIYGIDTFARYKKINESIEFLRHAQTVRYYMLCMFAVRNHMREYCKQQKITLNENEFDQIVHETTRQTVSELERYIQYCLQQSACLCNQITQPETYNIFDQDMYQDVKNNIKLKDVFKISMSHHVIHTIIQKFLQNPEATYQKTLAMLAQMLQQDIIRTKLQKFNFVF